MKGFILLISFFLPVIFTNAQKSTISESECFHDIEMIDSLYGYAYTYGTGKLVKTADGGKTWPLLAQLDSIYFEQIQFRNNKTGWICGENGKVYKTIDAGSNWIDKSITSVLPGKLLLYAMHFENADDGMIAGAVLQNRKLFPRIFFTTNGGKRWIEDSFAATGMILQLKKHSNTLWATGSDFIARYENSLWKTVFTDTTKKIGQIRDIAWLNTLEAVAVSFNGYILRTVDGGDTWSVKTITTNRLRNIIYHKGMLFAAGDANKEKGNFFISYDKGISWSQPFIPPQDVHRMAVAGKNLIIAGKNGMIQPVALQQFDRQSFNYLKQKKQ